jgi:uncharacterized protein (TIGR03067 family)
MRPFALLTLTAALVGCSSSAAPTAREPTDNDRLQGVWAVESVESGTAIAPEERQRTMDSRLHVHGNRFSLGAGDNWEFSTFAADWTQEPKKLLLFECGPDGKPIGPTGGLLPPPRTRGWLYKFEGEKLVLAFLRERDLDSVPPPADFRTEAGQNVMVLRLVRTNEQPRTNWDSVPAPPVPERKKQ